MGIYRSTKDFGIEPALYFHTPNSDYEDFPQKFDDFALELPCGDKQLERYLKQLADKGFTIYTQARKRTLFKLSSSIIV